MTIEKLIEIFAGERQDHVISEETVLRYVNDLETRLCTEVFLTHEDPPAGVYTFMGLDRPEQEPDGWPPPLPADARGYGGDYAYDDYRTAELLAPPPYDDIYRAYIQWRDDLANNDTVDAGNSQRVYWMAYQDFAKQWHRTHVPANNPRIA